MSQYGDYGDYSKMKSSSSYDLANAFRQNLRKKVVQENVGVHSTPVAQNLRDAISGTSHGTAAGRIDQ